ncbi:hypothetical protein ABIB82_007586 [Bradyrhizobium sp. i1.8.4]
MSGRATARRELYFWTSLLLSFLPLFALVGILILFKW